MEHDPVRCRKGDIEELGLESSDSEGGRGFVGHGPAFGRELQA